MVQQIVLRRHARKHVAHPSRCLFFRLARLAALYRSLLTAGCPQWPGGSVAGSIPGNDFHRTDRQSAAQNALYLVTFFCRSPAAQSADRDPDAAPAAKDHNGRWSARFGARPLQATAPATRPRRVAASMPHATASPCRNCTYSVSASIACPIVWPKFRMRRRSPSFSSAETTSAFTRTDARDQIVHQFGLHAQHAFGLTFHQLEQSGVANHARLHHFQQPRAVLTFRKRSSTDGSTSTASG